MTVIADSGISIATDGWHEATPVAAIEAAAFRLGSWIGDRQIAAVARLLDHAAAPLYRL